MSYDYVILRNHGRDLAAKLDVAPEWSYDVVYGDSELVNALKRAGSFETWNPTPGTPEFTELQKKDPEITRTSSPELPLPAGTATKLYRLRRSLPGGMWLMTWSDYRERRDL